MAFLRRVLEHQPVYYLGTDTGQVWRGSPEVGWTKLCECGAAPVNAIGPDLFRNERIFVVLKGPTSPGRIKELDRLANGTWQSKTIDAGFAPDVDVEQLFSVAVDPAVPATQGTTIYVGTDQGVYRGHVDELVFDPSVAALAHIPPILGDWTWRRSPDVPFVSVTDLEVQQNFQAHDQSGIVRAGTYGRGVFELNRASTKGPVEKPPLVLSVQAIQRLEDGAPPYPTVQIPVTFEGGKLARETPFELAPAKGMEVTLEAPEEVEVNGVELKFTGWAVGPRSETSGKITLKADEATKAVAFYEGEEAGEGRKAKPPETTLSAGAKQVCVQSFTHGLQLSWDVSDGVPPVTVKAEIAYPDKHIENMELKFIQGDQTFPMSYPGGGTVKVKVVATDADDASSSAEASVELKPCPSETPTQQR